MNADSDGHFESLAFYRVKVTAGPDFAVTMKRRTFLHPTALPTLTGQIQPIFGRP